MFAAICFDKINRNYARITICPLRGEGTPYAACAGGIVRYDKHKRG
jgi:hypothetical protein